MGLSPAKQTFCLAMAGESLPNVKETGSGGPPRILNSGAERTQLHKTVSIMVSIPFALAEVSGESCVAPQRLHMEILKW